MENKFDADSSKYRSDIKNKDTNKKKNKTKQHSTHPSSTFTQQGLTSVRSKFLKWSAKGIPFEHHTLNDSSYCSPPQMNIPGSYCPSSLKNSLLIANSPPAITGDLERNICILNSSSRWGARVGHAVILPYVTSFHIVQQQGILLHSFRVHYSIVI